MKSFPESDASPANVITSRSNAKVTVQYIQPQHRNQDTNAILIKEHEPAADELEVENVEYLDESHNIEEPELVKNDAYEVDQEIDDEDVFYPNAIHCLLNLYKEKYDKVILKDTPLQNLAHIWRDISREMQESYFEFEAEQVREKYVFLRQQYFNLKTQADVDNFEYFEELHSIYNDPTIDLIAKQDVENIASDRIVYKDENLMKTNLYETASDYISGEIVNKEHEFIDMVEKEIQARGEEGIQDNEKANMKTEKLKIETHKTNIKRPLDEVEQMHGEPPKQKLKSNEDGEVIVNLPSPPPPVAVNQHARMASDPSFDEVMTLRQLNAEQERRHCEQMALLNKQFEQHQTTLENLSRQIQELIKRLPPAL